MLFYSPILCIPYYLIVEENFFSKTNRLCHAFFTKILVFTDVKVKLPFNISWVAERKGIMNFTIVKGYNVSSVYIFFRCVSLFFSLFLQDRNPQLY